MIALMMVTQVLEAQYSLTTRFDAVTYNFNEYLDFNGASGLQVNKELSLPEYTASVWFKMDEWPSVTDKDYVIMQFAPDGFSCNMMDDDYIRCRSFSGGQLQFRDERIRLHHWHLLVVRSTQTNSDMYLETLAHNQLQSDRGNSFFPFGSLTLKAEQVYLGIDQDQKSKGFFGSVKELRLFSNWVGSNLMSKLTHTKLYWQPTLELQIIAHTLSDFDNVVDNTKVTIIGSPTQDRDFSGITWCFQTENPDQMFLKFDGTNKLNQYSIRGHQRQNRNIQIFIWILRDHQVQTEQEEIIFDHIDVMKVIIPQGNYKAARFVGYNRDSIQFQVPQNVWVMIQAEINPNTYTVYCHTHLKEELAARVNLPVTNSPIFRTSTTLQVGRKFNGLIRGIEYYQNNLELGLGQIRDFPFDISNRNGRLLYFLFTEFGITSSGDFYNFELSQGGNMQSNNERVFEQKYWNDMSGEFKDGQFNQVVEFDGFTCKDKRKVLYFPDKDSYARSVVNLKEETESMTAEFWFRSDGDYWLDSYFLNLESKGVSYFALKQEISQKMVCYPFEDKAKQVQVNLEDYQDDIKEWSHVACVWDGPNQIASGYLYQNERLISYIHRRDLQGQKYPAGEYKLFINGAFNNINRGIAGIKYKEIRIWTVARSKMQIVYSRQHMLSIESQQHQLLSYIKFGNGGFSQANEIDYADPEFKTEIVISNFDWIVDNEHIVCPEQTFLNEKTGECFLDPFLDLFIGAHQNDTHLIITPAFSNFINYYAREQAANLFTYNWNLKNVRGISERDETTFRTEVFQPQKKNYELVFPLESLSGGSKIQLSVLVTNNQTSFGVYERDFEHRVLLNCNIYDAQTGLSNVTKEIIAEKGDQHVEFSYQFTECGNYLFRKQELEFFYYTRDHKDLVVYDYNHDRQSQQIRLLKKTQDDIPLNEQFYLIVKGVWQNKNRKFDESEVHLIYNLMFVSKIVININSASNPVLEDQTMLLDSSRTYITNVGTKFEKENYDVKWSCPQKLRKHCQDDNKQIRITYNEFQQSGLAYWIKHDFSLTIQTAQLLGTEQSTVTKTVGVIWLNVDPDISLLGSNAALNNQLNVWTIQVNNIREDQISVKWSITPFIAPQFWINNDYKLQLVMAKNAFKLSSDYEITATITYTPEDIVIWDDTLKVLTPRAPRDGSIDVRPKQGSSLVTMFTLKVDQWDVINPPVSYQFYYQKDLIDDLKQISPQQESEQFITVLPSCLKIWVRIQDDFNAVEWANINVNVRFQTDTQTPKQIWDQGIVRVNQKIAANDVTYWSDIAIMAESLNEIDNTILSFAESKSFRHELMTIVLANYETMFEPTVSNTQTRYFASQAALIVESTTSDERMLNIPDYIGAEQMLQKVAQTSSFGQLTLDEQFIEQLCKSQSNILNNIKFLVDQGKHDPVSTNNKLAELSKEIRTTLHLIEKAIAVNLPENMEFNKDYVGFSIRVHKYSRYQDFKTSMLELSGENSRFDFPIQAVPKDTARQSVSLIEFHVNPFMGYIGNVADQPLTQVVVSNTTVHVAYRDKDGNEIDIQDFDIGLLFAGLNFDAMNTSLSSCSYFDEDNALWKDDLCETIFFNGEATCTCAHLSFYTIVQNEGREKPKVDPVILAISDWPAFIVVLYVQGLFLFALMYVIIKDQEEIRDLRVQDAETGLQLSKPNSFSLTSLAFKRRVFLMTFGQQYSLCNLWRSYILKMHPIFQLKHNFDPSIPKIIKTLLLMFRIVLVMVICFHFLYHDRNFEIVYEEYYETSPWEFWRFIFKYVLITLGLSLIFLPIPSFFLICCKSKFRIVHNKGIFDGDQSFDIENKFEFLQFEEKIKKNNYYIDPTLPIKLLFILSQISDFKLIQKGESPWANGNLDDLTAILEELELINTNTSQSHHDDELPQPIVSSQQNSNNQTGRRLVSKQSQLKDISSQNMKDNTNSIVNPGEITFELKEGGEPEESSPKSRRSPNPKQSVQNIQNSNKSVKGYHSHNRSQNVQQDLQGRIEFSINREPESVFDDKIGVTGDDFMVQRFGSAITFNSADINDDTKEIVEEGGLCCRLFWVAVFMLLTFGGLAFIIYQYYKEENYYNDPQYMWAITFFASQILGFFVLDVIVLAIQSCCVGKCCSSKTRCMLRCCKESYTIFDDLKFTIKSQEAHFIQ